MSPSQLVRPVLAIALLLIVVAPAFAADDKSEQEVRETIEVINTANLKGGAEGAALFDKYLSDDFTRIWPNGEISGKQQILAAFKSGKIKVDSSENSDIKVRIYGATAVVTGILRDKATAFGSHSSPVGYRWTRVFVKRGDVWQNVLYQSTHLKAATTPGT